nr:ATP-binding protein [Thiocapsa sp.]
MIGATLLSFALSAGRVEGHHRHLAHEMGVTFFKQLVLTRRWNALHNGVYVPVTDLIAPNPYLDDPARDVVTRDGVELTKINPAYMTRLLSDMAADYEGVRFKITSLEPLNPLNAADDWERAALVAFEAGAHEYAGLAEEEGGHETFRFMGALITEKPCLACHERDGYRIGSVRGGIRVSLPYEPFRTAIGAGVMQLRIGHLGFLATVLVLIWGAGWLLWRQAAQVEGLNARTRRLNRELHAKTEVERHLASVVESASDLLVSTDTDGRILSWNRAAARLTGYPADVVMHRGFSELFPETERPEVEMALSRVTVLPGSLSEEWTLSTASGEGLAVSWTIAPMSSEDGTLIGMVAAGRDLTERYRMQSELLRSQKLAALGVMAGGIAHEIRNPLAVCSSAAQFLLDDSLEPELQRECVEKTIAGVGKASEIIENLLRFARPCAVEKMTLVEPLALLKQALSVVSHQAQIARIEVEMQVGDRPLRARGVPSLLEQAFINLLLNAMAAMPAGGRLTIAVDQDGDEVSVQISDTGVGIHAADLLRIFDPFYTRSPIGQGTGLGLSICYSIIEQHRGRIDVQSEVGVGTCFHVRLPLAEPPCSDEA